MSEKILSLEEIKQIELGILEYLHQGLCFIIYHGKT